MWIDVLFHPYFTVSVGADHVGAEGRSLLWWSACRGTALDMVDMVSVTVTLVTTSILPHSHPFLPHVTRTFVVNFLEQFPTVRKHHVSHAYITLNKLFLLKGEIGPIPQFNGWQSACTSALSVSVFIPHSLHLNSGVAGATVEGYSYFPACLCAVEHSLCG